MLGVYFYYIGGTKYEKILFYLMEVIIMMKATRTSNNDLYQENLYQAYYNTPAEKHVVSESLEQEAMQVLVHRLAAQLGYTESEAEVEKEFLCEM